MIDVEKGCPTDLAIDVAAQDLARYARICQENGLVPIVEPEILIDGTHDITTTARVQERVLTTVYAKLQDNGVLLEGSLLKPSMTVPGVECSDKSDPATIAKMTVQDPRPLPAAGDAGRHVPVGRHLRGGLVDLPQRDQQARPQGRVRAHLLVLARAPVVVHQDLGRQGGEL